MPKHKKDFKQKLSEFTYGRSAMDKRFTGLKKSFHEVSSFLNDKKKK